VAGTIRGRREGKADFVEIRGTARLKFNHRSDLFAGPVRELLFIPDITFHRVSFQAFLYGNDSQQMIQPV
jgi:hypothetical protein